MSISLLRTFAVKALKQFVQFCHTQVELQQQNIIIF